MKNTKEVRETSIQKRGHYIHVETKGCIVNIYPSLHKDDGRQCTTVEVLPDRADTPYQFDIGQAMTRVVEVKTP